MMNNFVYVVFLSAAADILEDSGGVPKAVVLLADCLPSLLVKLVAPYFMHRIPYAYVLGEIVLLVLLVLFSTFS